MDNNTEQLKVLAEVFNTDKIITSDQIEQVLTGILGLLVRFKKENESLNNDTKTQVESILESIYKEHDRILKSVENSTQNVKSEATESITKAISEMKRMCAEVMEMKPKDGEKGEDADEEKIIEEVLAKIKLPEYKEVVLDDGSEIIAKINDEKVAKINASQIEGLPTFEGKPNGGGWRNLNQLHDVNLSNLANNDVLKYNSTTELWENGATSGTGTVTSVAATVPTGLTISGSPVTTSGTLAIGLDTGYVIPLQTTLDGKASTGAVTGTGITMSTARILGRTTASTGAIEELSTVDSFVSAASDTTAGKIEVATTAETNTGTDATRAVSPDGLAGSYAGTKSVSIAVFAPTTDVATGDGKAYITIPEALNGMDLVRAQATVVTAGTTNATTVMIHNVTDAVDMLSGAISIASGGTVGTVGTINTSNDGVATNDILRVDVDSVSTTAPRGLMVVLEFRLP